MTPKAIKAMRQATSQSWARANKLSKLADIAPSKDVLSDNELWATWAVAKGQEIAGRKWAEQQQSEVPK